MPLDVGLWEIEEIKAHVFDGTAFVKVVAGVDLAGQFALGAVQHVRDANSLQVLLVSRCSPETPNQVYFYTCPDCKFLRERRNLFYVLLHVIATQSCEILN